MHTVKMDRCHCISLLSNSTANVEVEIPQTGEFSFGESLESVYPLLDMIFAYLPMDDLLSASKVCKEWNKIANRVKSKRIHISWCVCERSGGGQTYQLQRCTNHDYCNAALGIVLYQHRKCAIQSYLCAHYTDTSTVGRITVAEQIENIMGKRTDYCFLGCPKLVSSFSSLPEGDVNENYKDVLFECVKLPEIPNIRTSMFHVLPGKLKSVKKDIVKENEVVKCLMVFCTSRTRHLATILKKILAGQNFEEVALAGAVISGIRSCIKNNQLPRERVYPSSQIFCIGFFQQKNVEADFNASSIVIKDHLTEADFEESLIKLRDKSVLRRERLAIRLCCLCKIGTKELENKIFKKVFPNTPLLGLEVNGEIGWNSFNVPSDDGEDESAGCPKRIKQDCLPCCTQEFSTVMLLLNWGRKC